MKYNPDLHHRHSIRLQNYDYANVGAYFITICCQNRINRFGKIVNNANNVGAGSACPIAKPNLQMQTNSPIVKPNSQMQTNSPIVKPNSQMQTNSHIVQTNLQMQRDLQQGQADPAPTVTVTVAVAVDMANTVNTMNLNEFGKIVDAEWKNLTIKYPNVNIGEYVIMPNHFHGIIEITERTVTIGNIIGYFKYKTTKMINLPEKLWQRNYWEHIIRDETEYIKIVKYIRNNPILWGKKCLNEILLYSLNG